MAPRGRPRKDAACRTCKIRRIKCDETRPACRRCTSTGRKCDGYASPSDLTVMPMRLFSTSQEFRSFKYFCEKTSLEITSHFDETFWQSLVLQLSHANSGLGHLVVAIGSLHESIKETVWMSPASQPVPDHMSFSLQQCNKAISILTKQRPEESSTGVLIASCVLVMAFEMLQNRLDAAMNQLNIGLRMLQAWKEHGLQTISASERDLIENHLRPMLDRSSQSSALQSLDHSSGSRDPTSFSSFDGSGHFFAIPSVFLNLGQARTALYTLLNHLFTRVKVAMSGDVVDRPYFHAEGQALLNAWNFRFQNFLINIQEAVSKPNQRRICLIRIQYLLGTISFAASASRTELTYDQYLTEFSTIISLCREIIEIESGGSIAEGATPMAFSFDLSIIMPLYFTVWKCRDPSLRRQACYVLKHCPRREGIWLSWLTAMVTEQMIDIEENRMEVKSCADVPVTSRIQLTHMHYDPCPIGRQGQTTLYQPFVRLAWITFDADSKAGSHVQERAIRLAPTTDERPGLRPYWVVMPNEIEVSHWKLFLARKVFEEPSHLSRDATMLA